MSEKTAKRKKAKAKASQDEAGVLGSLPATRATRVGGDRPRRPVATPTAAAPTPAPAPKPKAAAKPKPKAAAKPKPKAAAKPKPAAGPRAAPQPARPHRPRPVRAGAPALEEPTERARSEASEPRSSPPAGTELVATAIQAAGELAQIGLTVGGQVLKRAVKRLPKP